MGDKSTSAAPNDAANASAVTISASAAYSNIDVIRTALRHDAAQLLQKGLYDNEYRLYSNSAPTKKAVISAT